VCIYIYIVIGYDELLWCVYEPVPGGVGPPTPVDIGTTYILLEWTLPTSPNGLFTGFTLVQSPQLKLYEGALTSFNITNLNVRSTTLLCSDLRREGYNK